MPSPPTPARPGATALALLAVLAALATGLVFALAVHTDAGRRADDAVRGDLSLEDTSRAYAATQRLLDTISVSSLALLGLGIMGLALVRGRPWRAVGAGVVVLGANVTTQLMKSQLDRPDLDGDGLGSAGAFPSGHVTVAMSLAMGLVLVAPPALRWSAALAGWVYASGVGVAVVALDWHRPSEVVGAYLVAVTWTAGVAAVLVAAGEGREARRVASRADRLGAVAALVLGVAFGVVAVRAVASRLDLVSLVDDRTALAAAALAAALVCAALVATVATFLQRAEIPARAGADR